MNFFRVMSRKERAIVNIFLVDVTSTVVLLPAYLMHPAQRRFGVGDFQSATSRKLTVTRLTDEFHQCLLNPPHETIETGICLFRGWECNRTNVRGNSQAPS